jgi:hypothetical protein
VLRERSRPILAAVGCAAALTLAACGGGDEDTSTSSAAATTTGAEAAVTPLRRRLERELTDLIEAGETKVDAECVVAQLRVTLPNDAVEAATRAAARGDEIPTEAVDAAYAAGQKCAAP